MSGVLQHALLRSFKSICRVGGSGAATAAVPGYLEGPLISKGTLINVGPSKIGYLQQQRRWKADDRRELIQSMPIKDMGTQGEKEVDIDLMRNMDATGFYPNEDTPNQLFNGVKFSDLPVCHIKVSKNNTIIHLNDSKGQKISYRSCGLEGFKNTRKGTNIAAQTTALTVASQAKNKGYDTIKILIQGLGPGRVSSVKGLQMGGMKIVAIADCTPISWNPPRPRKARRL